MESTVISFERLKKSRNWGYAANSHVALWVDTTLQSSKYPIVTLGEYVNGLAGGLTPRGARYSDSGVIFVRVGNIKPYGLDLSSVVYIDEELHNGELRRCQLQAEDVLLAITGATFGKACVVPLGIGPANINQHVVRIRTLPKLNSHYLAMFFNSELGTKQSAMLATGGTRPALDYGAIRSIRIPLPPRPIQDHIAKLIQDAYAARREKLAAAESLLRGVGEFVLGQLGINIEDLQQQRIAIVPISNIAGGRFDFEAVVTVPELNFDSTEPILLRQVVKQSNDRVTPVYDSPDEEVNYISLGNIASNTGELTAFGPVKGSSVLSSSPKFKRGDILFGRMRPYLNKVWIAEFDGICSGEALVFRPDKEKVDTNFLQALLLSRLTLYQVVPLQSGTSLPRVSASDVLSVKLPIPKDLKWQRAIGEEVARQRLEAKRLRADAEAAVAEAKARIERLILGEEM